MITFCGSHIDILFDKNGLDCKECFKLYEDGWYKNGRPIISKHPNILKHILVGKRGWGLWLNEYTNGITDFTFTRDEILNEFKLRSIEIPNPFLIDFDNTLNRKKNKRNLLYLNEIINKK